jgi:uncharacterized repeat protein (TIGR03987 family)
LPGVSSCADRALGERADIGKRPTSFLDDKTRQVAIDRSLPVTTISSIVITLALVFYTIGVWSERLSGRLKVWHLVLFWLGLVCDTWGTGMMFEAAGGMTYDVHGLTGMLAIALMFIHAIWGTIVLARKDERWIVGFHRFSVIVWLLWLVPYLSPMFIALGE